MRELDRPATVDEIRERLDDDTPLKTVKYHLAVLVAVRVAKVVFGKGGPRFRLLSEGEEAEIF